MKFNDRLDNIYCIDTNMFGFKQYCAAYLIEGKEIALIDTGQSSKTEALFSGIKSHGFSVYDISYIFVTHCEHNDHSGNVTKVLKESPHANVYIHPSVTQFLTEPWVQMESMKRQMPASTIEKMGTPEPTPISRIRHLQDGQVFNLGNGETLQVIFAPGHQPGGIVLFEQKHKGLFINDLVGIYLPDADAHYVINPNGSDHKQAIQTLKNIMDLPIENLYLSHYGIISEKPKELISKAIANMQRLLDIGTQCIAEGKPESIVDKLWEVYMPELQKLRAVRGEALYRYAAIERLPAQFQLFTKYCQENLSI